MKFAKTSLKAALAAMGMVAASSAFAGGYSIAGGGTNLVGKYAIFRQSNDLRYFGNYSVSRCDMHGKRVRHFE